MFLLSGDLENFDLQYVKGIGPYNKKLLAKKGIKDIFELLTHFPRDYEDRRKIVSIGQLNLGFHTIKATVIDVMSRKSYHGPMRIEIIVGDETGRIPLIFFNQAYIAKVLKEDDEIIISGKVEFNYGRIFFNNPEWEKIATDNEVSLSHSRIVPIYHLTEGLSQNKLRKFIYNCLGFAKDRIVDPIPEIIKNKFDIPDEKYAIIRTHFPKNDEDFSDVRNFNTEHQKRLILDEIFYLQYYWGKRKIKIKSEPGISYRILKEKLNNFIKGLPFELTPAQKTALEEILNDMADKTPMNRLLQGDVGSGKTIVSLIAMLNAVYNGYQAAIMVPTEVLAQQHYIKISKLLSKFDIKVGLLYSKLKKSEQKKTNQSISDGSLHIVIGTHALFQGQVKFDKLGFIVIDEQHRFGVEQRMEMIGKGIRPDVLVMSATPIPRSLALTIYGDMDFSVINELPAGRKLIKTKSIVNNQDKLIEKIRSHFDKDEKSFVVFPLIEETEKMDLLSAEQGFEALSKVFGSENVELLHGKMKSDKKISVMDRFANKKVKILVSTTVIEVGIDVPEATLMIVMNAERFGLSQLHQLRGRVGRSNLPSECLLYTEHKKGARIKIMEKYNDGFDISREDFKLRGPGEIMGTSQSGVPPFKLFNVFRDRELVELSHDMIGEIKREYGGFNHPDLRNIELIIEKFYKEKIKYSEIL